VVSISNPRFPEIEEVVGRYLCVDIEQAFVQGEGQTMFVNRRPFTLFQKQIPIDDPSRSIWMTARFAERPDPLCGIWFSGFFQIFLRDERSVCGEAGSNINSDTFVNGGNDFSFNIRNGGILFDDFFSNINTDSRITVEMIPREQV
jgi:hypothetical protein